MASSGSHGGGGLEPDTLPEALTAVGSFVSLIAVSFVAAERGVAHLGRLTKLVFNCILSLGLYPLLPGNMFICFLSVPSTI